MAPTFCPFSPNSVIRWFPCYSSGGWLPYTPNPHDVREWNIELNPPTCSPPVAFDPRRQIRVSLHRLLIEAGIALTPATSIYDPRTHFALYRYSGDFSGTAPRLRFYSGVSSKDPRLTAVASEEISVGIACYILREHFDLAHITDAYAALQAGELQYVNANSPIRPDFFCQDLGGEVVIAESKGATGTRSTIAYRIDSEGWDQVQNVQPINHHLRSSCSRIVIGTHFCIDGMHPRSETTTIIKDPEGKPSLERDYTSDTIIRQSYAKCLRFIGQDNLADRLLVRQSTDIPADYPEEKINGIPFMILGLSPFGDLVGLASSVAKALFRTQSKSLTESVTAALKDIGKLRSEIKQHGYILSNGVAVFHEAMSAFKEIQ